MSKKSIQEIQNFSNSESHSQQCQKERIESEQDHKEIKNQNYFFEDPHILLFEHLDNDFVGSVPDFCIGWEGLEQKVKEEVSEQKFLQNAQALKNPNKIKLSRNKKLPKTQIHEENGDNGQNIHLIDIQQGQCIDQQNQRFNLKISPKKILQIEKHFFNHISFNKKQKISLAKKIAKLYLNHVGDFLEQNSQIWEYYQKMKMSLQKKYQNDYTFEKTISGFLGEVQEEEEGKMTECQFTTDVSSFYRHVMPQIIRKTMKKEVILRQKIDKNKLLYMIQLKIYSLRCRSHKLAKRGCFK